MTERSSARRVLTRVRPVHWLALDLMTAAGYGMVAFLILGNEATSARGWLFSALGAAALGVAVAVRRMVPVASLAGVLVVLGLTALWVPEGIVAALPGVILVLYSVAARSPVRIAAAALVASCGAVLATALPDLRHPGGVVVVLPFFVAAWSLGLAFGLHRRHLETQLDLHDRLRLAQVERAELETTAQRVLIARELHDVVAHGLSVITVQAGFAGLVVEDRDQVRQALHSIETAGRQTLAEMRSLLAVLRQEGGDPTTDLVSPAPGLGDLGALLARTRDAGVKVAVTTSGRARPLSPMADLNTFRVVQEALTNVVRHAGQADARVCFDYADNWLTITVRDDGRVAPSEAAGHGITGMRERATLVGGSLYAGVMAGGGYEVVCRIPLAAEPWTTSQELAPA